MIVELLFEPRDLWVGLFLDRRSEDGLLVRHVYLGIPFLVLHISWSLGEFKDQPLPLPYRIWGNQK